jgi:hypothetical protein
LLTRYAASALTEALAGRPIPAPPSLAVPIANAAAYVGRYAGPDGAFEVRASSPLSLVANGREAVLQPWGDNLFRTTHPDFRDFTLMFEGKGTPTVASWGSANYAREGSATPLPKSDPKLTRFAGRYINDSPWWGTSRIVERGGKLWLGTETPMTSMSANLWRVGEDAWSPERASFADFIDGRPQTFIFSGVKFERHDI